MNYDTKPTFIVKRYRYGAFVCNIDELERQAADTIAQFENGGDDVTADEARKHRQVMNAVAKMYHTQRMQYVQQFKQEDEFESTMERLANIEKMYSKEAMRYHDVIASDDARLRRERRDKLEAAYSRHAVEGIDFDDVEKAIGKNWYIQDVDMDAIERQISDFETKVKCKQFEWQLTVMAKASERARLMDIIKDGGFQVAKISLVN